VSPIKQAELFEKAAEWIEKEGWWAARHPHLSHIKSACIMNALAFVSPDLSDVEETRDTVLKHFGVVDIDQVFEMNDKQSDEDGPQWAIDNLREIAQKLRAGG
jgi:hypothetical protein